MVINVETESVQRLGREEAGRSRPIILVKFRNEADKLSCLKAALKLKGSNIYINEDLSRATLDMRREKLDELRQKRQEGYIAYFKGANIIVKSRSANFEPGRIRQERQRQPQAVRQPFQQLTQLQHGVQHSMGAEVDITDVGNTPLHIYEYTIFFLCLIFLEQLILQDVIYTIDFPFSALSDVEMLQELMGRNKLNFAVYSNMLFDPFVGSSKFENANPDEIYDPNTVYKRQDCIFYDLENYLNRD